MKGIILAAGRGTRLYPLTIGVSKQLLPVYNKPLVYYPLSVLMMAGIREVLFIVNVEHKADFQRLLGDGQSLGCAFEYAVQREPNGLAEAFLIGEKFVGDQAVALALGDNLFYGAGLEALLQHCSDPNGGIIFAYHVQNPAQYGVVDFDADGKVTNIEEKPKVARSHYAVPGLYFYDANVVAVAHALEPSARGELEITDVNRHYLSKNQLKVKVLDKGTAWLDAGTFGDLSAAGHFVEVLESRQGVLVGAVEEVAYRKGFVDEQGLRALAKRSGKSGYGEALLRLIG